MGFDGRTLTYSMSTGDVGAAIVLLRAGTRWSWINWVIPGAVLLVALYNLATGEPIAGLLLLGLVVSTLAFMYSGPLNGLFVRSGYRSMTANPVTLTLSDDGLDFVSGPSSGHLDWSAVQGLKEDRRVLLITRDEAASWAIIPKAAFAGQDELKAFREAVLRGQARARRATAR